MAPDQQTGKYGTTARLFKQVSDMPRDQQLVLLRQLVGENVASHLFKLIIDMSEEQQVILLDQMEQLPESEMPVKTVSLEETGTSMRENHRKPCLINANYQIHDRDYKSYILDISIGGVFIETDKQFPAGQTVKMKFNIPHLSRNLRLDGKIAWSSPEGFGVKFENIEPAEGQVIKSYVDQGD